MGDRLLEMYDEANAPRAPGRGCAIPIAVIGILLAVLAGSCWWGGRQDGPELAALKKDAMAAFRPSVGTLEHEFEQKAGRPLIMGKQEFAQISRTYVLTDAQAVVVYQEAVAAALAADWQPDAPSASADDDPRWTGGKNFGSPDPSGKRYADLRLSISIFVRRDPNDFSRIITGKNLYVSLEHA